MKKRLFIPMFTTVLCTAVLSVNANTIEQTNTSESTSSNESIFTILPDGFDFSSGAGAWGTFLDLNDDGTFSGEFHDSNMGETGEGYPNGTVYVCDFSGKFSEPEKIDEYTYSMQLEYLAMEHLPGEEYYEEGVKYVYSDPYGFENAVEFYIYLPNTPVSQVPDEFMMWSHLPLETTAYLPEKFYGIYNINEELGFVGYVDDAVTNSRLSFLESEDERINAALYNAMTQAEINAYSNELYVLWDDELNAIWKVLKNILDEQTMSQLTNEQLQWIYDKEDTAELEAAPYEGGSLYPAVYNDVVYRWTKERVYYLVERFPEVY